MVLCVPAFLGLRANYFGFGFAFVCFACDWCFVVLVWFSVVVLVVVVFCGGFWVLLNDLWVYLGLC